MKKIIIILAALFLMNVAQAQTGNVTDTLIYLKKIELRKADFIGKPFSVLLDSLKIQIKSFSPHADIHNDTSKETSTALRFIIPESVEDFEFPYLNIYWEPYLNHKMESDIFDISEEGGLWIPEAVQFYSTGIIKDIKAR